METEADAVKALLEVLLRAPLLGFPVMRGRVEGPRQRGVYIIYDPSGNVAHVGRTPRARGGISQRLRNHLGGRTSFAEKHLRGDGHKLRDGYKFRYLIVDDDRKRALLEAYATGCLCPEHLGLGSAPDA